MKRKSLKRKRRRLDGKALLKEVQRTVRKSRGRRLGKNEFLERAGAKWRDALDYFPSWERVLVEAGCSCRVKPERLFEDWGRVARIFRRPPTRAEYKKWGKHDPDMMERRLGKWKRIAGIFRDFAADQPQWADVMETIPQAGRPARCGLSAAESRALRPGEVSWMKRRLRAADPPVYGSPLNAGALRHAPTNENGVIFAFGMVAERLGFLVENVRGAFPDCEAKRHCGPGVWKKVRIEFEHQSRNFRHHGHDPKGCDLIVCWEHNWPECPVEVLALKDELEKMKS